MKSESVKGECTLLTPGPPRMELRMETKSEFRVRMELTEPETPSEIETMTRVWDELNPNPKSYVPDEFRSRISQVRAKRNLDEHGDFVDHLMDTAITEPPAEELVRRYREGSMVAVLGAIQGRGIGWVPKAMKYGLQSVFIDLSNVMRDTMEANLFVQWEHIFQTTGLKHPRYRVIKEEMLNVLLEPENVGIDLEQVKVWLVPRTLGVVKERTYEFAVYTMGQSLREDTDPTKQNRIVITSPMCEFNSHSRISGMSLREIKQILEIAAEGAERPVRALLQRERNFLGEIETGLILGAE